MSFPYFLEYPIKIVVKKLGILGFFGWVFQRFGKKLLRKGNIVITERIIEIPTVYLFLSSFCDKGDNILEIGHVNSSLSLELASLGYKVMAVDIRDYPFEHRNLTSIKADFLKYEFDKKFKCVISVSTIEHLGYNKRYGGDQEGREGLDELALEKIKTLLDSGGKFILTVPYAANIRQGVWFRVYTKRTIEEMLGRYFTAESKNYFIRKNNQWFGAPQDASEDPEYPYDGVAMFLLSKK